MPLTNSENLAQRWYRPALIITILLVSLFRVAGIFDDFWLDEIWSWQFAMSAHSARDILLGEAFHHDNNHILNTLFIYALGDQQNWRFYRLLSLSTGVGLVILTGAVARRWGRPAAITAVILTGFSYMFVHFSSEARGYAPAAFFAMAAFAILRRFVDETAVNSTFPETVRAERENHSDPGGRTSSSAAKCELRTGTSALQDQKTLDRDTDNARRAKNRLSQSASRCFLLGLCFGAVCILGLLSHASFIYALVGAVVWIPVALFRAGGRHPLKIAKQLLTVFFVPWLFLAWFYRTVLRVMTIGGGPSTTLPNLLAQISSFTLGLPLGPLAGWIGTALAFAIAAAGVWILWRESSDEWIFLLIAGLIAPAAILGIHHEQMYPRYLFVALPFLVVLAARAIARLSAAGRFGLFSTAFLLLLFVCGNMLHIRRFLTFGRGHYFSAVEYIAAHTTGKTAFVGGYSEFRTTMLLDFYATRIPMSSKQLIYVPDNSPTAPEWYLFTPRIDHPIIEKLVEPQWKSSYQLKADYLHYGLAGWDWALYHRANVASGHNING